MPTCTEEAPPDWNKLETGEVTRISGGGGGVCKVGAGVKSTANQTL